MGNLSKNNRGFRGTSSFCISTKPLWYEPLLLPLGPINPKNTINGMESRYNTTKVIPAGYTHMLELEWIVSAELQCTFGYFWKIPKIFQKFLEISKNHPKIVQKCTVTALVSSSSDYRPVWTWTNILDDSWKLQTHFWRVYRFPKIFQKFSKNPPKPEINRGVTIENDQMINACVCYVLSELFSITLRLLEWFQIPLFQKFSKNFWNPPKISKSALQFGRCDPNEFQHVRTAHLDDWG